MPDYENVWEDLAKVGERHQYVIIKLKSNKEENDCDDKFAEEKSFIEDMSYACVA